MKITKIAILASLLVSSCLSAHADILIGVAGPTSGNYAVFGQQMVAGAKQAVENINKKGGVNGEKLVLKIADDACDPKQAVAVANKLVADGVKFVVGHFCSGSSIAASGVYNDGEVITISPASTSPKLTDERPGPGVYRICSRDDKQGVVAGKYIADHYKNKNIAILHDKTAYGKGLADNTKKNLNDFGKIETLYEAYTPGERDYSALVTKLKSNNIDVLYIGGYHTEVGLILRQIREQGLDSQVISGDALTTSDFWSITGKLGEGTLFTFNEDVKKNNNPATQAALKQFKDKGIEAEGYTLNTYVGVEVWAKAANAAKSFNIDDIIKNLDTTKFKTVIGNVEFDEKGDNTATKYVFYKWNKDGNYSEIEESSKS